MWENEIFLVPLVRSEFNSECDKIIKISFPGWIMDSSFDEVEMNQNSEKLLWNSWSDLGTPNVNSKCAIRF